MKGKGGKMGTAKEGLLSSYDYLLETAKICLAIKMPDGSTELIINQNAKTKIDYIRNAYDDDLKLKNNGDIQIVSYMFYE